MPPQTKPSFKPAALCLYALAGALLLAVLIMPMLWNGGPFIFHDTDAYLLPQQSFRAIGYSYYLSAILALTGAPAGIAVGQGLMLMAALVFTAWAFEWPVGGFLFASSFLLVFSTAPLMASYAMPDLFTPLAFLVLYTGLERSKRLWRQPLPGAAWLCSVVIVMAFHDGNAAILLLVLAGWCVFERSQARLASLPWRSMAAVAALSLLLFRLAPALRWQNRPGGTYWAPFLVSRFVEEGLVQKHGGDICREHPENKLACGNPEQWLTTTDFFLWEPASPLQKLHRGSDKTLGETFAAITPDCVVIIKYIVAKERFGLIPIVLKRIRAIFRLSYGDELLYNIPFQPSAEAFARHIPGIEPVVLGEKQNNPEHRGAIISYIRGLTRAGTVMGWAHVFLLLTAWLWSRRLHRWAVYTALVIFSNNAVCAVFSCVDAPRYPGRVAFLSALLLAVFLMETGGLLRWLAGLAPRLKIGVSRGSAGLQPRRRNPI